MTAPTPLVNVCCGFAKILGGVKVYVVNDLMATAKSRGNSFCFGATFLRQSSSMMSLLFAPVAKRQFPGRSLAWNCQSALH